MYLSWQRSHLAWVEVWAQNRALYPVECGGGRWEVETGGQEFKGIFCYTGSLSGMHKSRREEKGGDGIEGERGGWTGKEGREKRGKRREMKCPLFDLCSDSL